MKLNRITFGYLATLGVIISTFKGKTQIQAISNTESFAIDNELCFIPPDIANDSAARDIFEAMSNITDIDVRNGEISCEMQKIILDDCTYVSKIINPKKFYTQCRIGFANYVINYTDGETKNFDGSPFYDAILFSSSKMFEKAVNILLKDGFIKTS